MKKIIFICAVTAWQACSEHVEKKELPAETAKAVVKPSEEVIMDSIIRAQEKEFSRELTLREKSLAKQLRPKSLHARQRSLLNDQQ